MIYGCYTRVMPTTLKRTMVTHTPSVQNAIDVGKQIWPGASDSECLVKLVEKGAAAMKNEKEFREKQWREIVKAGAGCLSGAYPEGYLEEIREGWPE